MGNAIRVHGLGKQYRIGALQTPYRTLREMIISATSQLGNFLSKQSKSIESNRIWALKNLNFDVGTGETIGIIGRNGAGKSTLLKLLSHITNPSEGWIEIHGRVGSLLEVGTGFHNELTGRENIFLNGAILGMSGSEIKRKFDEIVSFSEVEQFLDTPVKRYSSGMYMRLAFSVAAHLDTEILLVDEVLAVGDVEFQRKCLGKMDSVAHQGRTVLFVSHNMGAITRLCTRTLWIDMGSIILEGNTKNVVEQYQVQFLQGSSEWVRTGLLGSNNNVQFQRVGLKKENGEPANAFNGDESILVEIEYSISRDLSGCQIGVRINNFEGSTVFSSADSDKLNISATSRKKGNYLAKFEIPAIFLAPGKYSIFLAAHLPFRNFYDLVEQTVAFEVLPSGSLSSLDGRLGMVAPLIEWNTIEL